MKPRNIYAAALRHFGKRIKPDERRKLLDKQAKREARECSGNTGR